MNTIDKMKVVWICHFSNDQIKEHIQISNLYYKKIITRLFGKPCKAWNEFAVWNTNALHYFENYSDIELTVIFPYPGIKGKTQHFIINGINYVAFRSESDFLIRYLLSRYTKKKSKFEKNRKLISSIISKIQPDIVHVIGAENPYYSFAALDIPKSIPSIVSLQTLLSAPDFQKNYPMNNDSYQYYSDLEKKIIRKCNYIGSVVSHYNDVVTKQIKPNAVFLKMPLAVGVDIDNSPCKKEFDFVYFAANINKACDDAIEAFALACKYNSELTLNVSGDYSPDYKAKLDVRIQELGIARNVIFTGPKATHDDVMAQIKKSRFALLPLKVDLISGTVREAMACGLPVVTSITQLTPTLNSKRESVLLSPKGDYQAMANNMIKLLENEHYASVIRENAFITIRERHNNERTIQMWRKAYYEIIDNFKNGVPLSEEVITK